MTPDGLERLRSALLAGLQTDAPGPASPFMTAREAADYLRCNPKRVYDLAQDGRLDRCGDGRRFLVRRDQVELLAVGNVTVP